uniref:pyruvate kinase n=1 Tax=Babesia bovis TaxID=5865 RepID=S6B808_BABBO|nr:pyruvate kinase family protein [Babesia bovis]
MPNVDAVGKGIESSAAEFVELKKGDKFTFDTHDVKGSQTRVRFNFPDILRDLNVGNTIAMDDGNLNLEVISVDRDAPSVTAVVLNDGVLSSRKGFAVPNVAITVDLFSEKDVKDTIFSYALGLDFLGVSFVQRMTDILYLKNIILDFAGSSYMQPLLDRIDAIDMNSINTEDEDPEIEAILQEYYIERFLPAKQHLMTALPHLENVGIAIIPKMEKQPALDDINGILEVSDGMMIARGDLGVETEITNLPVIQKRLIQLCRLVYHKPVIVATQMLESMKSNPKPSRAEATDCANAVYDGADAVMLSAESATGSYPAHSVRTQRLLLYNAENDPYFNAEQLLRESLLNEDIMSKLSLIRPREVAKIMSLVELDMLATREWNTRHALLRDAANDVSMVIASEDVDALIVHVDDKPELIQWIATKRRTLPIVMLTSRIELARRMLLTWSVKPHMLPDGSDAATYAEEIAPLYVGKDSKVMYIECEDNKVLSSVVID